MVGMTTALSYSQLSYSQLPALMTRMTGDEKRYLAVSSGFGDQLMIKWCGPGVAG